MYPSFHLTNGLVLDARLSARAFGERLGASDWGVILSVPRKGNERKERKTMWGYARRRDDPRPGQEGTGQYVGKAHSLNLWIISGIFYLVFLDHGWPQITEILESETMDYEETALFTTQLNNEFLEARNST